VVASFILPAALHAFVTSYNTGTLLAGPLGSSLFSGHVLAHGIVPYMCALSQTLVD